MYDKIRRPALRGWLLFCVVRLRRRIEGERKHTKYMYVRADGKL